VIGRRLLAQKRSRNIRVQILIALTRETRFMLRIAPFSIKSGAS